MNATKPRFCVDSLTGYTHGAGTKPGSMRKPSTSWSVYDRAYNCKEIAVFYGVGGEARARAYAEKLNGEEA